MELVEVGAWHEPTRKIALCARNLGGAGFARALAASLRSQPTKDGLRLALPIGPYPKMTANAAHNGRNSFKCCLEDDRINSCDGNKGGQDQPWDNMLGLFYDLGCGGITVGKVESMATQTIDRSISFLPSMTKR